MNPLHLVALKACGLALITISCGEDGTASGPDDGGGLPTGANEVTETDQDPDESDGPGVTPNEPTPPPGTTPSSDPNPEQPPPGSGSEHGLDAGETPATTDDASTNSPETLDAGVPDEPNSPSEAAPTDAGSEGSPSESDASDGQPTGQIEWQETEQRVGIVRLEAATLKVPVDYAEPAGEQLDISLARLRTRSASRAGVLLFNPGGPGASLLTDVEGNATLLGSLFPNMDIILMDNRGTGRSSPLQCIVANTAEPGDSTEPDAGADAGAVVDLSIEAQVAVGAEETRAILAACREALPTRLPHFNTENVARDMEQLRLGLGEAQLNYWGVSYGTLQGALYAAMFPHGVGSWVLDSPVYREDYQAPDLVDQIVSDSDAYEAQLRRFFDHCDQSEQCLVSEGLGQAEQSYAAVRAKLEAGGTFLDVPLYPDFLYAVTELLLRAGRWDLLEQVLSDGLADDWYLMLVLLISDLPEDEQDTLNQGVSNRVILGIDFGCPEDYDLQAALSKATQVASDHPHLGSWNATRLGWCAGWDLVRDQAVVTPSNVEAAPFAIMAGLHDPATPYVDALALHEQLGNGSTLLTSDAEGHGAALATDCATAALIEYIESGDLAAVPDTCEAVSAQSSPLSEEKRQAAAALRAKFQGAER